MKAGIAPEDTGSTVGLGVPLIKIAIVTEDGTAETTLDDRDTGYTTPETPVDSMIPGPMTKDPAGEPAVEVAAMAGAVPLANRGVA